MIRARKPRLDTRCTVPRHWFAGSPVATHLVNAVSLIFPAGERFFVRSVRHYQERIEGERLRAEVRGFFGQEGRHAQAHESDFDRLRAQGYSIDRFLRVYERIAHGFLERIAPPALRLAATAAAEHFTAIMAERALGSDLLEGAHPEMRRLLKWHAAEEIEHKHVAFEVLQQVSSSHALRLLGLAMSTLLLGVFWAAGAAMLLRQDGYTLRAALGELRRLRAARPGSSIVVGVFWKGICQYVRRDFHPRHHDTYALAERYLAEAGLEPARP